MSYDPSGIRLNYKYAAEKEEDEESEDRGEEVSYLTDDASEHFVSSLIRIPCDEEPSGIRLQYEHNEEDGGERQGGGRFLEPTLIRLPPAEEHEREYITSSDADDNCNKKPAATAELSRAPDHDVSPKTVIRTLSESVDRVQFPLADSPTYGHLSKYKMEMRASKNSHSTAPPIALDAASLGDPLPSSSSSSITTMLPEAQWASPESARIKNDLMDQAATGNKPILRPHIVSSQAMEPLWLGSTQLKSPPVLSPSTNVAAAAPPATATGPENNHEVFMHVKASIRAWEMMNVKMKSAPMDNTVPFGPEFKDQARVFNPIEKERIEMNAKIKSVPTDNRVPFGPKFKDQARNFNPIEKERVENVDLHDSSAGGPTFRHQTREEGSEEEIDTEAGETTSADRSHGVISNGTTRLVQAELVIPTEAEVIEEKPQRKAWLVVLAVLLMGAILGGILSDSGENPGDTVREKSVPNAGCNNATALELDGTPIAVQLSPNNSFMVDDSTLQSCGAASRPTDQHIGIWYTFVMNMTGGVRISTCTDADVNDGFDRNILLFTGPCDHLTCLPKNNMDHGGPPQGCGRENAVSFQALRSTLYHVLVYGKKVSSSTEGNFTLQATSRQVRPTNSECEGATTLEDGEWHNSSVLDANAQDSSPCFFSDPYPAVWFRFESRKGEITITTCSPVNAYHNIYVFSGGCSSRGCLFVVPVAFTMIDKSLSCNGTLNLVQFFSYDPATYLIMVLGVTSPYIAQILNPALVNITDYVPPHGHEDFAIVARTNSTMFESTGCDGAVALELGKTVAFRPAGESNDTRASCNISNPSSVIATGSAWFQIIIGNDTRYTATTCSEFDYDGYDFTSQINLYSGIECQNLTCVSFTGYESHGNFFCNDGISWLGESGIQYWIQVFVFSNRGDSFPIAVFPTPPNQDCDVAIMLEAGQAAVHGTTLGALAAPEDSFCGYDSYGLPAVWYSVTGTDEDLTVITCTESLAQSQILVYNGTCGSLLCIDENYVSLYRIICSNGRRADTAVSWFAKEGMNYYIKVTGYGAGATFELEIQVRKPENDSGSTFRPLPPPDNDLCRNARQLSNNSVQGSLEYAQPSDFLVCNGESLHNSLPDVWYQFNGTGEWHTVTVWGSLLHMAIYSGICRNLTCITGTSYSCQSKSFYNATASWHTEEGELYMIRVLALGYYFGYSSGSFGIQIVNGGDEIKSSAEPVNNHCENATLLELDQVVNGTTLGATPSWGLLECSYFLNAPTPDVWYFILGTGDVLTVTTCTNTSLDDSAFFSPVLELYTGSCTSEMTCSDANSDDHRDACSDYLSAGVSWQSELDVPYFVRVYGYYDCGTFGIKAYSRTPDGKPPPDPFSTLPPY